jgi:hypothetical protein
MTKWRSELIMLGLFMLMALVGALTARSCVGEQEKQQSLELKKLASEIAPYPRATANGDRVVFKTGLVYLFVYFTTQDDFSEVRAFYDQQLTAKGWTKKESPPSFLGEPPGWRRYRKGDYVIVVERDERHSDHFDLAFEWNPGQE